MRKKISPEIKDRVIELLSDYSTREIALLCNISQRSVFKIIQQSNIKREPGQLKSIRSKVRKKLVQDERRRVIFGTEQKTNLKVFSNRERHSMKYKLKRKGYKKGDLPNTFFYSEETKRNPSYEMKSKSLGITILQV